MQTLFVSNDSEPDEALRRDEEVADSPLGRLIQNTFAGLPRHKNLNGLVLLSPGSEDEDTFNIYYCARSDFGPYRSDTVYAAPDLATFERADFEAPRHGLQECYRLLQEFVRRLLAGELEPLPAT